MYGIRLKNGEIWKDQAFVEPVGALRRFFEARLGAVVVDEQKAADALERLGHSVVEVDLVEKIQVPPAPSEEP